MAWKMNKVQLRMRGTTKVRDLNISFLDIPELFSSFTMMFFISSSSGCELYFLPLIHTSVCRASSSLPLLMSQTGDSGSRQQRRRKRRLGELRVRTRNGTGTTRPMQRPNSQPKLPLKVLRVASCPRYRMRHISDNRANPGT